MSASTSDRFPYVDLSGKRTKKSQHSATDKTRSIPGIPPKPKSGVFGPIIAGLMGQIAPSKAKSWAQYSLRLKDDGPAARQKSFKSALHQLADMSADSDRAQITEPWPSWGLTGQPILPCLQSLRAL